MTGGNESGVVRQYRDATNQEILATIGKHVGDTMRIKVGAFGPHRQCWIMDKGGVPYGLIIDDGKVRPSNKLIATHLTTKKGYETIFDLRFEGVMGIVESNDWVRECNTTLN